MAGRLRRQLWHLLIALDQLLNVLLGGYADETLSSRTYRRATQPLPKKRWRVAYTAVNALFFWQHNHCRSAHQMELERRHLPDDWQ